MAVKSTKKKIIYAEPVDYFPKEIRDEVFGKKKTTKKTDKKK